MKYSFPSGATIEGTLDQILAIVQKLGETPTGFHLSEKGNLVEISAMATPHLIHALHKRTVSYFEKIKPETKTLSKATIKKYCQDYVSLLEADPELVSLYKELQTRF